MARAGTEDAGRLGATCPSSFDAHFHFHTSGQITVISSPPPHVHVSGLGRRLAVQREAAGRTCERESPWHRRGFRTPDLSLWVDSAHCPTSASPDLSMVQVLCATKH